MVSGSKQFKQLSKCKIFHNFQPYDTLYDFKWLQFLGCSSPTLTGEQVKETMLGFMSSGNQFMTSGNRSKMFVLGWMSFPAVSSSSFSESIVNRGWKIVNLVLKLLFVFQTCINHWEVKSQKQQWIMGTCQRPLLWKSFFKLEVFKHQKTYSLGNCKEL